MTAADNRGKSTTLVWRWRTVADPNRPKGHRIAHPLAARAGDACRLICQGRNGNRLVEFEDGYRTVAPLYATRTSGALPVVTTDHGSGSNDSSKGPAAVRCCAP